MGNTLCDKQLKRVKKENVMKKQRIITYIMTVLGLIMIAGCNPEVKSETTSSGNTAPQNLKIDTRTDISIKLTWDIVTKANGYRIYMDATDDKFDETSTVDASGTNSYTINGLTEGKFMYVKVTSVVDGKESGSSSIIKVFSALKSVTGITVNPDTLDYTNCTISWGCTSTKAIGFRVYRSVGSSSNFIFQGAVASTKYQYTQQLNTGNLYYYKVIAYNIDTYSNDPDNIPFYLCTLNSVSNAVINDDHTNAIDLSWSKNSNVDGYRIYWASDINGPYTMRKELTNKQITSWQDTGLTPGTRYYYKIVAYSGSTVGDMPSNDDALEGITMPGTPTNITMSPIKSGSVTVNWTAPSSGNWDGVKIYRYGYEPDITMSYLKNNILDPKATVTLDKNKWADETVSANTEYYYIVSTYVAYLSPKNSGKFQYGAEVEDEYGTLGYKQVKTKPACPKNLKVGLGTDGKKTNSNTVYFSWSAPGAGTYKYTVQYLTNVNTVPVNVPDVTDTYYRIDNCDAGVLYGFSVSCTIDGETSDLTDPIYVTTGLDAPGNLQAAVTSCTNMHLSWSAVTTQTQTVSYRIYRSGVLIANNVPATQLSYDDNDSSLLLDTAYTYTVEAAAGGYTNSAVKTITFSVPVPGGLAGTIGVGKITVSWTAVDGATGYVLEEYNVTDSKATEIPISGGTTSSYPDTGLSSDKQYKYRIKAICGTHESNYSSYTSGYTPST
jgi:fibronectin type 3 domain-containing protein